VTLSTLRALLETRAAVGTFLKLPQADVVDVLALAGLDFLICDTEHAQIAEEDVRNVLLAGRAAGIHVVVRVPTLEPGQVNRFLEAGASGIQLSGASSARQVSDLSAAVRYPPTGRRSVSTAQPAARFGQIPLVEYLEQSNRDIVAIGQLESADYLDPLDDIMAGLDLAFIGTMDLSVDLGFPGQVTAPPVQSKMREIEAAAGRTGTPLGLFASSIDEAQQAMEAGYRYIAVSSDLALLSTAARHQFGALVRRGGHG
jgi:4-hydroxy-2-oxoheptanedioate aldolase